MPKPLDPTGRPEAGSSAELGSWPSATRFDEFVVRLEAMRQRPAVSAVFGLVIVGVLVGGWWIGRSPPTTDPELLIPLMTADATTGAEDSTSPPPSSSSADGVPAAPGEVTTTAEPVLAEAEPVVLVHVAGEVRRPGVVELAADARIIDAIAAAGGPTDLAEIHRLNLAAVVADGMQVRVPDGEEEVGHPSGLRPPAQPGDAVDGPPAAAPVDLNAASEPELQRLHGIGPALAAAIVDWRSENGPFTSVDQLTDVPGIGPATLARIVDDVVVGP